MSTDKRVTRSRLQKRASSGTSTPRYSSDKPKEDVMLFDIISKLSDQMTAHTNSISIIAERLDKLEKVSSVQSLESEDIKTKLMEVIETTDDIALTTKWLDIKITEEQTSKKVKKECNLLKDKHNVVWKEAMNARKTGFWHSLQNYEKAQLYTEWIDNSPEYLPLKYRPKVNASDGHLAVEQKVNTAKAKYRDDISLMMHHSDNHDEIVKSVDVQIQEVIIAITESEDHRSQKPPSSGGRPPLPPFMHP